MDSRTGFRRDNKRTKFTNSYKGQEIVESPKGTWYIEQVRD